MSETFSRADGVLSAGLDDELVLYDPRCGDAHTLDAGATRVWEALAEPAGLAALIERTGLSEDQVLATLAQLEQLGLLEAPAEERNGVGRREVLRRGALLAAAGVGLPTVASLAVPGLAAAASTPGTTGNPGSGGTVNQGPTGLAIQQGPPPPSDQSYQAALGVYVTVQSLKPKSANGYGYYALSTHAISYGRPHTNGKGYYAKLHQKYANPGQPVSNASDFFYRRGASANVQCVSASASEPCTTYYAKTPGAAAVCASYGNPYVCNGIPYQSPTLP